MDKQEITSRMNFLLENPQLATQGLYGGDHFFSNCHGTTAYVLGVENEMRKLVKTQGELLQVYGRPSCVERDLMKRFIEDKCQLVQEEYQFGDIVALWNNVHRRTGEMPRAKTLEEDIKLLELPPVMTIEHTAILISPEQEKVFHQVETGREFEFSTIDKYIQIHFPKFRKRGKNLFVDFYRLNN